MNGANGHILALSTTRVVFLDSYPLGLLTDPKKRPIVEEITNWATSLVMSGNYVYVPEVIDYELRRELLRAGKLQSVRELNAQKSRYRYAPITTGAMLLAAELWARMRSSGTPTGDPKKLDIDVVLAAQAIAEGRRLNLAPSQIIVATSNVAHLSRMVTADLWQNIAL